MTIVFAVLEKKRPGLSSWEEMGWGGGQFPTAPQLGPMALVGMLAVALSSNPWVYSLWQLEPFLSVSPGVFMFRGGKLSPGHKLPGVTESRAWQGLASGLVVIPFVAVRIKVELGKDGHTVSFPETQCARLAEAPIVWAF